MENDTMQIGITEKEQTGSIAYILDSEDQFDEIGFRVMQNQTEILLKSHKLKYNGKIKFVYFTDGYAPIGIRPLKDMIWIITSDGNKQNYPGKTIYIPKNNE